MESRTLKFSTVIALISSVIAVIALAVGGAWFLYSSVLANQAAMEARIVGAITERINAHEANANTKFASIDARIARNGELISQLSERVAAVEAVIRVFHPSMND